jgi:hypothetical protein
MIMTLFTQTYILELLIHTQLVHVRLGPIFNFFKGRVIHFAIFSWIYDAVLSFLIMCRQFALRHTECPSTDMQDSPIQGVLNEI